MYSYPQMLFSSEAVAAGHPDKVADQLSDAVVDAMLAQDPQSRVACETIVNTGMVMLCGEVRTRANVDLEKLTRDTIRDIGYTDPRFGFDANSCAVILSLGKQASDIAQGVDATAEKKLGAGDQGIMFGYACDETPELMPLPITLARKIVNRAAELRTGGEMPFLRPDGKSQITVEYRDGQPSRVHTVVASLQHEPDIDMERLRREIIEKLIRPVLPAEMLSDQVIYHINATGRFVEGGPQADCGLTGRKVIADTYGGAARHGGGAFSGKDPTKVDRSASYCARYAAKTVVAAGLARRCEIQIAYAIGVSEPLSLSVHTFGTGKVGEERLATLVRDHFDFTPEGMIRELALQRPVYLPTARWGHFGREEETYTWERRDRVEALRRAAGV